MYEYISFDVLKVFAAQDGFSLARKALIEASCYEDGEGTPVARIYVLYIYIYISCGDVAHWACWLLFSGQDGTHSFFAVLTK